MLYDLDLKKQWDDYSALETAKKEGERKGLKEGERKKAIAVAIEMKKDGMSIDQIAKFTKLTIEELRRTLRSKIETL